MQNSETIRTYFADIANLQRHGEYTKCYECAKKMLALCEQDQLDQETRCRMLIQAAKSSYYVSRFDECVSLLTAADGLIEKSASPSGRGLRFESAIIRANVCRRKGKLRDALAILEPYGDADAAECGSSLIPEKLLIEGACHFYLNERERAEERLEIALGLATQYSDSRVKARVLIMLGLVAQIKGLHETALEYFDRAKDFCSTNADYYGEAAAALDMGILLGRRGKFSAAERNIERAKAIFERIEWRIGVCRCTLALGNISKCKSEFVSAIRLYREAARIAESNGFARESALAAEFIGDVHYHRGRYSSAENCYRNALRIADSIAPDGDIVVEINRRMGELHLARADETAALPLLRRGLRLSQRLGDKLEKGVILRCMGSAALARGDRGRGMALFQSALRTLKEAGCDFELGNTHLAFAELLINDGRTRRGELLRAGYPDDEMFDEAWSSAVEANHLFGSMDIESSKAAAERCIAKVVAQRRRRFHINPVLQGGRHVVKINYVPEFMHSQGFVAVSAPMLALWEQSRFAAGFDRPVLITGETGTGKEIVARMIHSLSGRARKPFVALNCAAVPDHLFESEFFGHKKGCFTGALMDRIGFFEEAHSGTLFLDEVGELTPLQQVKLLRVLQEGKIRRVGENVEHPVNVRIISATNQNLEEKLGKAALREDFYYRINAEHIHVPALRERQEDIIPLIGFCLCANGNNGQRVVRMELSALKCLQQYPWPGNIRELFAVLERAKHISNGDVITLEMLPERIKADYCPTEAFATQRSGEAPSDATQRLRRALDLCGGNKSAAARWLGISRGTLYKELKRSGLLKFITDRSASLKASPSIAGSDGISSV